MLVGPSILAVVAFVAVFMTIEPGTGLRCYDCNSHTNKSCSDKKPADNLIKNCDDNNDIKYTMCRKIVQTIDFEVNGLPPDNRVIRSCAWDTSQYKNACYQRSGFGGRQDVCSCIGDLCNGASSQTPGLAAILAVTITYAIAIIAINP